MLCYRVHLKEREEKVDRRIRGNTTSKSGQGWTLLAQLWHLKIGLGGKGMVMVVKSSVVSQCGKD